MSSTASDANVIDGGSVGSISGVAAASVAGGDGDGDGDGEEDGDGEQKEEEGEGDGEEKERGREKEKKKEEGVKKDNSRASTHDISVCGENKKTVI